MANDPGLANDTCIFIEAIKGDKGVHAGTKVWWLSPDIIAGTSASPNDFTVSGPVKVRFRRKAASSNCQFPGDESISVQLWAAKPSLVLAPDVRNSAQLVQAIGSPVPAEGGTATQQIALTSSDPDVPIVSGPKTLLARCYSESKSPSSSNFFLPGDQHVALRNLFVTATSSTQVTFKFNTLNPVVQLTPTQKVKLKAVLDLSPDAHVRNVVSGTVPSISGSLQFRAQPLVEGFRLDVPGFATSNVIDPSTQPPVISPFPTDPTFEAQVELLGRQVVQVVFSASLRKVAAGEACVFHITQHSLTDEPQGGLTLVVLKQ